MSVGVPTWPKIQTSLDPRVYMRNGVTPSGPQVGSFTVGLLNHCLGHRMRMHFCKSVTPTEGVAGPTTSSATSWRWMLRTLPNETSTRVRVTMIPAAVSINDHPHVFVRITRDSDGVVIYDNGVSGIDGRMWHGPRSASPTAAVLDSYAQRARTYSLAANTLYRCELVQGDMSRVVSLTCYGVPRSSLETSTDVVVDPAKFLVNQPITSTQNADVLDSLESLWKLHGSAFAYSVPGTTAKTVTGTTMTNILDATTTWTASTKGFRYPSLNKHSLETTLGTPTYAVPIQAWVYASSSATGQVRFRWGTGASDYVDVVSITAAGWYKATGTIPGNADQKIDITAQGSGAAVTCSVFAAGIFDYSA